MHMKSFPFKLLTAAVAEVDKAARVTAAGVDKEAKRVACTAKGLVKAAANMMIVTNRDNSKKGR